jgi:hypothetical protein
MSTQLHILLRAAASTSLAAALLAAVPAAHSQMYRWTDAQGSVTYSNQLPSDMGIVKDLTVVLENPGGGIPDSGKPANNLPRVEQSTLPPLAEPPQASPPRIAVSPNAPEAVRDPCLRSADPKCIERNKAAYVPGRGYAGSAAVGATPSAGAAGAIAGAYPAPTKLTPPKSSVYALPPGSEPAAPLPATKR